MTDHYVSQTGDDNGSGSLADPWRTLAHAVAIGSTDVDPVIHIQPGIYAATLVSLRWPITLIAAAPGVIVEPASSHGVWIRDQLAGHAVWRTNTVNLPSGKRITQATWQSSTGPRHRIPVWNPAVPLDTPDKWASAVLGVGNPHTRWGLYSTSTNLYLIPPVDGSWTDPNTVRILTGYAQAFTISGHDVTIDGLELPAHTMGVRLDALAGRAHLVNLMTDCNSSGIAVMGGISPISYGHDHLIEGWTHADNGHCIKVGEAPLVAGQGISWNVIKTNFDLGIRDIAGVPVLVHKPLGFSETAGLFTSGGATNLTIQDSVIDGSFDGHSYYYEEGRFDAQANTDLAMKRVAFRNIADDAIDAARWLDATYEDCTFENVGTVLSIAPLYGHITLRNCTGWLVGNQVRVPDGKNNNPPGSVIKCGSTKVQGTAHIESCIFWSANPTTQGISQDGGVGAQGPRVEVVDSVFRTGYIVVNWPYPATTFVDEDNLWATSGSRPLKTVLPIALMPASIIDGLYYSPATGDFSLMSVVDDLEAKIADLTKQITDAQAVQLKLETAIQSAREALNTAVSE